MNPKTGQFVVWSVTAAVCLAVAAAVHGQQVTPQDWPQWRADAGRSGHTRETLATPLHPQWTLKLPPQRTAWRDERTLFYDRAYEPIIAGGLVVISSTATDSVSAYDLASGQRRWRFFAGGPVRFAPAAWRDRVFAVSDDGHLYCLNLADGKLVWKFRGGPRERWLVGNERVVSTWPARGGPVVMDDKVYFAAGLWPFMGAFVHALDAATGRLTWTNDSASFTYRNMPHPGSESFAGLSPQGHLAAAGDRLIVPGGWSSPAVFDRASGEFLFYGNGSSPDACAVGRVGFAGGEAFSLDNGYGLKLNVRRLGRPVLAPDAWHTGEGSLDPGTLRLDAAPAEKPWFLRDRPERVSEAAAPAAESDSPVVATSMINGNIEKRAGPKGNVLLRAADLAVMTAKGQLQIIAASDASASPKPLWQSPLSSPVASVAAGRGRLVVACDDGSITCFGPGAAAAAPTFSEDVVAVEKSAGGDAAWTGPAAEQARLAGVTEGYALVLGLRDGGLVRELVRQTQLHVVAVDGDTGRVDALRQQLAKQGVYGLRAAAIESDPANTAFAPYLASLIVSETSAAVPLEGEALRAVLQTLRPYGGTLCLSLSEAQHQRLIASVGTLGMPEVRLRREGTWSLATRAGPLPGSASWIGQNADPGNSRCGDDDLVRAPLGVLWWGNALPNSLVLPRHGEGPVEQVTGGRLFIEGPDSISATDVYTGRLLWTRQFPGLGKLYNSMKHQRGAHSVGSNFFVVADAAYVAFGRECLVLDTATGQTRATFKLPLVKGESEPSEWHFLLVYEGLLIAGSHPTLDAAQPVNRVYSPTSSRRLVVMDRHTGKVLWTRDAKYSFRHYGIVAGDGKVFCVDRLSPEQIKELKPGPEGPTQSPVLAALDARTGREVWTRSEHVGEQLTYSPRRDVLLAGAALRGRDGTVLWTNPQAVDGMWWGKWGLLLNGDVIYTQGQRAFSLLTGEPVARRDGADEPWRFSKAHGCGPIAASRHLLTFRSGSAGFLDLLRDGGTGNLGGFRTGCTSNLIAADGVLNAPDYTRSCVCAYQNRSSLALVTMPEVEYWTFGAHPSPGRWGLNFGAPGDRRTEEGTLMLDCPTVGGRSIATDATFQPAGARRFLHHSTWVRGGNGLPWVAASGLVGVARIEAPLKGRLGAGAGPHAGRVRLTMVEPDDLGAGQRVFDVRIDGVKVATGVDVAKQAGGARRSLMLEFTGLSLGDALVVELLPHEGSAPAVICGVEVVADHAGAKAMPPGQ